MSFTKAELIGQAMLRVEGGKPNPDASAKWGEYETYLAMAVNYVMTGQYWAENRSEAGHNINPLLYTVFENVPILKDTSSGRYYFTLPKNIITLPKGRALEVNTMSGQMCYPLTQGDDALEKFYGPLKKVMSYQIEGQATVWVYNKPPLANLVRTKQWVHVGDLLDTDLVILPSDGDTKVVDLIVNFMLGERREPKDYTEDSKDN